MPSQKDHLVERLSLTLAVEIIDELPEVAPPIA